MGIWHMNDVSLKYESIKRLNSYIKKCNRCSLSTQRINAVCGEGNLNARFFFIAQAPGKCSGKS